MAARIPERLAWAVDLLAVQPGERILEIGCGRGAAIDLICARLGEGQVVGLDRSATGIAAAAHRNRVWVAAGKARFIQAALADAVLEAHFDKVLAVNVNIFWLEAQPELAVIRNLLRPGGRLYLVYEHPSAAQIKRISEACAAFLQQAGYSGMERHQASWPRNEGLAIVAAPHTA